MRTVVDTDCERRKIARPCLDERASRQPIREKPPSNQHELSAKRVRKTGDCQRDCARITIKRLRASENRAPLSGRASEQATHSREKPPSNQHELSAKRVRKTGDCQRDCASNHNQRGKITWKRHSPSPSVATTVPPCATMISRLIARPSPLPPPSLERLASSLANRSKTRSRS